MKHFNNIPQKVRKKEFQSPWAHSHWQRGQRYSGPLSHSPGRQPPRGECLLFLGQRWGDDEVLGSVPYQVYLEHVVPAQVSLLCVILFPWVTGGEEETLEFGNPSRGNGVQTGWLNHLRMHSGSRMRITVRPSGQAIVTSRQRQVRAGAPNGSFSAMWATRADMVTLGTPGLKPKECQQVRPRTKAAPRRRVWNWLS